MQEKSVIRSRTSHGMVDLTPLGSTALGMDDLEIACTWAGTWHMEHGNYIKPVTYRFVHEGFRGRMRLERGCYCMDMAWMMAALGTWPL